MTDTTKLRNPDGTFPAGMSQELRDYIGERRAEAHRKARELMPPIEWGMKRCSACGKRKHFDTRDSGTSDFSINKRKLRDGTIARYPSGRCKRCAAEDAKARRAAKTPAQRRADHKRWNANRDPDAEREYQRIYQENRRREAGIKPRKKVHRGGRRVEAAPLTAFLRMMTRTTESSSTGTTAMGAHQLISITELGRLVDVDESHLSAVRRGVKDQIELSTVDAVLTHFGCMHLVAVWYPEQPE